jgi:hypothetical protein
LDGNEDAATLVKKQYKPFLLPLFGKYCKYVCKPSSHVRAVNVGVVVGGGLGALVGALVGGRLGALVGVLVGVLVVGIFVGELLGEVVGEVGAEVFGDAVCVFVGWLLGVVVGCVLGVVVGVAVGSMVGWKLGCWLGCVLGIATVGIAVAGVAVVTEDEELAPSTTPEVTPATSTTIQNTTARTTFWLTLVLPMAIVPDALFFATIAGGMPTTEWRFWLNELDLIFLCFDELLELVDIWRVEGLCLFGVKEGMFEVECLRSVFCGTAVLSFYQAANQNLSQYGDTIKKGIRGNETRLDSDR